VDAETLKLKVEDRTYEIPTIDDLDLDEWEIMFDVAGLVYADFAPAPDRADEQIDGDEDGPLEKERLRRVMGVKFWKAMLHIACRRDNPTMSDDAIRKLVGRVKRTDLDAAMSDAIGEGEAPTPLDETPEPEPSSPEEKDNSNEPKSNDSPKHLVAPGLHRVPTGTRG
jgi:hypothetical protein